MTLHAGAHTCSASLHTYVQEQLLSYCVCVSYRSFKADETFTAIGEKLCLELGECLTQHGFSPFHPDKQNDLKGQIAAVKSQDNPIRKLVGKYLIHLS